MISVGIQKLTPDDFYKILFLDEKIDSMRFLGTLFIATGITLVALSSLS